MTTRTVQKLYDNGAGVEVQFYDKGIKVGEACTANFEGKPNGFLHGVEVDKQYRNKGYGSAIVTYMINKYNVDTLYVEKNNEPAIHIYKKFGFEAMQNFDEQYVVMKRSKTEIK